MTDFEVANSKCLEKWGKIQSKQQLVRVRFRVNRFRVSGFYSRDRERCFSSCHERETKKKFEPQTFGFRAPMLWTKPSLELTISLSLYTLRCSFKGSRDKIHRVSQQTLRFFVWKKILGSLFFRATQLLLAQRHGTLYSIRSTIFLAIW